MLNSTTMEVKCSSGSSSLEMIMENNKNEMEDNVNAEDNVEEPKVGMLFNTYDELTEYYTKYAKRIGFGVSKRTSKKGDDGELRYLTVGCSRGGKSRCKANNLFRSHPITKTDCKAKLRAALCPDGKWRVTRYVPEHNHVLSPGKSQYYGCNKAMRPYVKRKFEMNERAGITLACRRAQAPADLPLAKGGQDIPAESVPDPVVSPAPTSVPFEASPSEAPIFERLLHRFDQFEAKFTVFTEDMRVIVQRQDTELKHIQHELASLRRWFELSDDIATDVAQD